MKEARPAGVHCNIPFALRESSLPDTVPQCQSIKGFRSCNNCAFGFLTHWKSGGALDALQCLCTCEKLIEDSQHILHCVLLCDVSKHC